MSDDADAVSSLRATAHPLRLRILSLLTGAELSAAEVARELDVTHANASYHLRVLADAGEVVVAGEEKIRGGVAKRYRHPWDGPQATSAARQSARASGRSTSGRWPRSSSAAPRHRKRGTRHAARPTRSSGSPPRSGSGSAAWSRRPRTSCTRRRSRPAPPARSTST